MTDPTPEEYQRRWEEDTAAIEADWDAIKDVVVPAFEQIRMEGGMDPIDVYPEHERPRIRALRAILGDNPARWEAYDDDAVFRYEVDRDVRRALEAGETLVCRTCWEADGVATPTTFTRRRTAPTTATRGGGVFECPNGHIAGQWSDHGALDTGIVVTDYKAGETTFTVKWEGDPLPGAQQPPEAHHP